AKLTPAPGSVAQAMPWRLKAANRAAPCGVPLARLPSSSSAARRVRQSEPVAQPSDVQVGVAVLQVKAAVAVARERYQSRSVIVHAPALPGLGRSRLAKSHSASEETYDSQCPSRPQGPG